MIKSFPPIIDQNTEILILGTMPGKTSLEKQEYYAYKHNHFWKIIYSLFSNLPISEGYENKIKLLQKYNIGLWDVLAFCERKGSLDVHIKNQIENDFIKLFREYPSIKKIIFNGKESHNYFQKKFGQIQNIEYHIMPSTSPANTMSFEKKLVIWRVALL